jgi:hypothetical protein
MERSMPVPFTNTTCDIYRAGITPPAAPAVAGVPCFLAPKGLSTLTTLNYSHVLYVDWRTDIRDSQATISTGIPAGADRVYVPNRNGSWFTVVLVRRLGRGTAFDQKQVILARQATMTWPSNDV